MAPKRPHRVGLVLVPEGPIFELSFALEVFGDDRPDLHDPWYELHLLALDRSPTRLEWGLMTDRTESLDAARAMDTLVVPALAGTPPEAWIPPPLLDELRAAHARGARVVSICTGALILAAAGLLDGRRATTHWMHADELLRRHPRVRFQADVLYVEDGGVFTSAGSGAGLDLCLHLVALDFGARVANALARRLVVPPHREGGQAQYVERPLAPGPELGLAPILAWGEAHLREPITVDDLAAQAHTSARTLARRFDEQIGTTPMRWLAQRRLLAARELLEATDLPLEQVAGACGFGSGQNLRLHFVRALGTTPNAYRRAFRLGSDAAGAGTGASMMSA
jgi:AraC family transcriptional regulator, transcriptional activator FtrA